jgi:hypothetical protein
MSVASWQSQNSKLLRNVSIFLAVVQKNLSQRDKSNISNMSNIIFDFRAGAVGLKKSQNIYRMRLH